MPLPMALWLDEHMPRSVAAFFVARGHAVELVRDHLAPGTPDSVVAAAIDRQAGVIVTHDKDFRTLIGRRRRDVPRYPRMGLIQIGCQEVRARERLEKFTDLIELEHDLARARPDPRLLIHLGDGAFTVLC